MREAQAERILALLPCAVFEYRFGPAPFPPHYSFVGSSVQQLLGVEADAILRDPELGFRNIPPDDAQRLRDTMSETRARDGAWKPEFRVIFGGCTRWIEMQARVRALEDGTWVAHGYWAEITERKRLEADRREDHERFRGVFESAPQPIGICNQAGMILALNPAYSRTFGYSHEQAPTLSILLEQLYPDADYRARVYMDWSAAEAEYRRTQRPGPPLIARMRCKDGRERVAEIRTAVASNGDAIVMFNDITEQLQAQNARAHAEAERITAISQLHLQSTRMPMALIMMDADPDLTIRDWNPAAERIFGFSREEALGESAFSLLIPQDARNDVRALAQNPVESGETLRLIHQNSTKDGRTIWCEWFNTPVCDASGKVIGMMSMAEDVSERVKVEERARLWSSVLDHSSEGIMICDDQLRIVLVNAAFEAMTGYSEPEAMGQNPRMLHSGRQSAPFYRNMWASISETGRWQGELWNRRKNGQIYPEWLSINAARGASGAVTHYVGIFSDLSARKESEQRILHLAQYDALTDLPNRALLMDRLSQLTHAAARENARFGVLFIDLDLFKQVNDSIGHDAGDLLLVAVAIRLTQCLRQADTIARMGGDEFVVLLPQLAGPEDAALVAEKLLKAIAQPIVIHQSEFTISASIGICIFPGDGATAGQLLRNADAAMYQAKSAGRQGYQFYTTDMNARALERLSLQNGLRRALEQGELVLYYQPQIDVRSGRIIGVEALMRWNRPEVGLVPPVDFIPIAEECGLIVPMGKWAIEEAARQIAAWEAAGLSITVAVNLSASQFHQKGFVEHVAEVIAAHRIDPHRLELELTETIIVRDANATILLLERLHLLGVALSIDDFGTGYSSLSYLRRFPVDRIKIDKSFIDEIAEHAQTTRVVRAIIALVKGLDLRVVAEGVETQLQLDILREAGCDEVQGYLFSRPVPPRELETLVRQWPSR